MSDVFQSDWILDMELICYLSPNPKKYIYKYCKELLETVLSEGQRELILRLLKNPDPVEAIKKTAAYAKASRGS